MYKKNTNLIESLISPCLDALVTLGHPDAPRFLKAWNSLKSGECLSKEDIDLLDIHVSGLIKNIRNRSDAKLADAMTTVWSDYKRS